MNDTQGYTGQQSVAMNDIVNDIMNNIVSGIMNGIVNDIEQLCTSQTAYLL